jgi:hypothetical protein
LSLGENARQSLEVFVLDFTEVMLIRNRAHVLGDLQPYVCTYADCSTPDQLFSNRHSWLEHERLAHRQIWQCSDHPVPYYHIKEEFEKHIVDKHPDFSSAQAKRLADLSENTLTDERQICPFCHSAGPFPTGLGAHMAFHHEKLATFALKRADGNSSEDGSSQAQRAESADLQGSAARDSASEEEHLSIISSVDTDIAVRDAQIEDYSPLQSKEIADKMQEIETRKRVRGPEHPNTLASMWSLASTYSLQQRWDKAIELLLQVIEGRTRVLGPENPETLTSMESLAQNYWQTGKFSPAEVLLVKVVEGRKKRLGPEHQDTLRSMYHLGITYRLQGRWNEAMVLQKQVMETRKAKLGEYHPDTLISMELVASQYKEHGQLDEAEELEAKLLEARSQVLGTEHPQTLNSMSDLAVTYTLQNQWNEALELQEQVLETRKAKLGDYHPDTLTSMELLASHYKDHGQMGKAEILEAQLLEARSKVLEPENPSILASKHLLSTNRNKDQLDEPEKQIQPKSSPIFETLADAPGSSAMDAQSKSRAATEADAIRARIPAGYSTKNWDPSDEPIILFHSVFDANSLGKWIFDWASHAYGPGTPMSDTAGELWLLLIQLAGKCKRADEAVADIRDTRNRELVEDFLDAGERLWIRFKKLLKACEEYMPKATKTGANGRTIKTSNANLGAEFVQSMFGRDKELDNTQKWMANTRLWSMRFDANVDSILRDEKKIRNKRDESPESPGSPERTVEEVL